MLAGAVWHTQHLLLDELLMTRSSRHEAVDCGMAQILVCFARFGFRSHGSSISMSIVTKSLVRTGF
jgi:hypothetical protein